MFEKVSVWFQYNNSIIDADVTPTENRHGEIKQQYHFSIKKSVTSKYPQLAFSIGLLNSSWQLLFEKDKVRNDLAEYSHVEVFIQVLSQSLRKSLK